MSDLSNPASPGAGEAAPEEEIRQRYWAATRKLFEEARERGEYYYLADALTYTLAIVLAHAGNLAAVGDVLRRLGNYLYGFTSQEEAAAPPETRPVDATLQ